MDETETYIKMCDCEEIQGQKPEGSQGEFIYCEGEAYQEMDDRPLTPFIWLPRQDDLQKMVNTKDIYSFAVWCYPELDCSHVDSDAYCSICIEDRNRKEKTFTSMEQLWLAFVMKEKFDKVWTGEKWEGVPVSVS